jgi:hypothetical protein
MSENLENKVEATEPKVEQTQQNIQESAPVVEENFPEETPKDLDWKKFKEKRKQERLHAEKLAKEAEEAKRAAALKEQEALAIKQAMEALLDRSQNSQYKEDLDETEEQRIQRKVNEAFEARERQRRKEEEEREKREWPQRLASTYRDFEEVCSPENVDYLEFHHPEIVEPYRYLPEGYEKWKMIYNAVKKYVPNHAHAKKDQVKAEKNMSKPQSMNVAGLTQTGDSAPQMLTDKKRDANWSRMVRIMKGLN